MPRPRCSTSRGSRSVANRAHEGGRRRLHTPFVRRSPAQLPDPEAVLRGIAATHPMNRITQLASPPASSITGAVSGRTTRAPPREPGDSRSSVPRVSRAEGAPAFTMNQLGRLRRGGGGGTNSAAAEKLHVSPSALSAAVSELERALRVELLRRRRAKGVSLTPTGRSCSRGEVPPAPGLRAGGRRPR